MQDCTKHSVSLFDSVLACRKDPVVASAEHATGVYALQRLCERCVANHLVEPRTVLQVLEFADAAGSLALRQHCIGVRKTPTPDNFTHKVVYHTV